MANAEKLSITLPAELARLVREKVETGGYASNSEVIREALRVWQEREGEHQRAVAKVRSMLQEAIDDPRPPRTMRQVRDRLDRLHEATLKESARTTTARRAR